MDLRIRNTLLFISGIMWTNIPASAAEPCTSELSRSQKITCDLSVISNLQNTFQRKKPPEDKFIMVGLKCPDRRRRDIALVVKSSDQSEGRSIARFQKGQLVHLTLAFKPRDSDKTIILLEQKTSNLVKSKFIVSARFNEILLGTILTKVCFGSEEMKSQFISMLAANAATLRK